MRGAARTPELRVSGRQRAMALLGATLACLGLAGCAARASRPPQLRHADGCGVEEPRPGHSVEVYLRLRAPAGTRPFCPGHVLHPEDTLIVEVAVARAAHVAMAFIDPAGEAGVVERQDRADLTRLAIFEVPAGLLTHHAGEAQLFLIVSEQPLEVVDPAMHRLFEALRTSGTVVDREGRLHTSETTPPLTRPLHFETSATLHAELDARGMAALGLSLRAGD